MKTKKGTWPYTKRGNDPVYGHNHCPACKGTGWLTVKFLFATYSIPCPKKRGKK